jgi:NADH-quinone oxidoreductase subunit L
MTAATFAIAGFPPLSGFFSKDDILGKAFVSPFHGHVLWTLSVITAGLTSFYMFRLWFMTFFGERRTDLHLGDAAHGVAPAGHGHDADHALGVHESPRIMVAPLVVLAVGSIVTGWVGIPQFLGGDNRIDHFLQPAIQTPAEVAERGVAQSPESPGRAAFARTGVEAPPVEEQAESNTVEWELAGGSVAVAALGFFFAWLLYYKQRDLPDRITAWIHGLYVMVLRKYYVDEAYGALLVKPLLAISTVIFWRGVDQGIIDGLVNGAGKTSKGIGNQLRRIQSGNIRSYAAWVATGGAAIIVYMIWHSLAGVAK